MRVSFRPSLLFAAGTTLAAGCAADRATAPAFGRTAGGPAASAAAVLMPAAASHAECAADCERACERGVARARARLERAATGLTYTSESDYPFEFVSAPPAAGRACAHGGGARGDIAEDAVRAAFGVAVGEPVEVVSLDAFFARHIENADPSDRAVRALVPRYRALKRTVHATTGATRVYRVGRIQVRCYLVGTDPWGNVVGLATTAIET